MMETCKITEKETIVKLDLQVEMKKRIKFEHRNTQGGV